ncbi:DUF1501 domain-containing protein [Aquabacterium sp.]|uniref:DUF1501 domain-containing protein n=1 Tax=Aquabacterium sp. TaxID=1872578 RepID=UPI003784AD19
MDSLLLTRRRLLAGAGALLNIGGIQIAWAQSPAKAPPARLVVVMLRGAVDGLSLLAPHGEAAYYEARPTIAIGRPGEADGLLKLDSLWGLHPALAPMLRYWQRGQLGFVHASGSPDATRSHFDAQDYMESGTPGRKTTPDGWLNRLAGVLVGDHATPAAQRLQALNLGPVMPRIFSGDATVASLASGQAAVTRGVLDRPRFAGAFAELYSGDDRISQAVREASATRAEIMDRLASDDPKADQGALSLNGLPRDTARLGQLMARDARVRLAFVPVGGWDTHANQGNGRGQLANRLALLAQSLDALAQGLGDRLDETSILVLSEFGRTLKQNGTGGTDHGHGNVAWLMGGGVRGGRVHGRWPGLDAAALYEGRDLAITTDFRDVVADVLEQRFRLADAALARVLPGMDRRQPVGLFAERSAA